MQAFEKALPGLQGKDAIECRYRLGLTRFVLKQYEKSAEDLSAYLAADAEGLHAAEAQLYLARTHLERGDLETAGEKLSSLAAGQGKVAARGSLWYARVYTRADPADYDRASGILAIATEEHADSTIINDCRTIT